MRVFVGSLLGLFAATLIASAQPGTENIDTVLRGWEKAMTDLRSFVAVVERTTIDKSLNARDDFKGYAMFMAPMKKGDASKARLEMAKIGKTDVFEKYIIDGKSLFEYAPAVKTVRVHPMPANKGMQQESFLSFLFGMSSEDAQKRYVMTHVVPNPPDKFYHYVLIRPRMEQDKADFVEARLSLLRSNNLPAQIWYLQPNKSEVTWSFKEHQVDVQIPAKYFAPDDPPPAGWRVEVVQPKGLVNLNPKIRN
jgi:TIGR03009 family protein